MAYASYFISSIADYSTVEINNCNNEIDEFDSLDAVTAENNCKRKYPLIFDCHGNESLLRRCGSPLQENDQEKIV